MAKLYFYYAAMNAGKTTKLLQSSFNYKERGMDTILYTYKFDNRFGESKVASRIGIVAISNTFDKDLDLYTDISQKITPKTACILIDEAQFLTKNQVLDLCKVVDNLNIPVLTYGLRTDFQTRLFEGSRRLFEIADSIEEVKSTCNCGRKTIVNARIDSNGEIITEGEQVEIGGNDRYIAVCRKCWRNKRIEMAHRDTLPFEEV